MQGTSGGLQSQLLLTAGLTPGVGELPTAVSWRVWNTSKDGDPPRHPDKAPSLAFLGEEEEKRAGGVRPYSRWRNNVTGRGVTAAYGGSSTLGEWQQRCSTGKFFHVYVPQEGSQKSREVFQHRERTNPSGSVPLPRLF